MDDGFVMMSQNSESREIKDTNYLESLLIDAESGLDPKTHSDAKHLDLPIDDHRI